MFLPTFTADLDEDARLSFHRRAVKLANELSGALVADFAQEPVNAQHNGCTFLRRASHERLGPLSKDEVREAFEVSFGGIRGLRI